MLIAVQAHPGQRSFVEVKGNDFACLVDVEFQELIKTLLAEGSPESWQGLQEVKSSTVRRILSGTLGDRQDFGVHVKLFRAVRLSDYARDAMTGSRAHRELNNLRQAREKGLPCIRPIAAGTRSGKFGSRSFLVTETFPGTSLPRGPLDSLVAERAGKLLARAHDTGLRTSDLHPGNILQTDRGELVLLDLTSALFSSSLGEGERAHALAFFCRDLDGNVLDPAAQPLIEAYGASPRLLDAAVQKGRKLRHRALSSFARRALRACAHTSLERDPAGGRWYLHRPESSLHPAAIELALHPPDPLKSGRRGTVHMSDELALKDRPAAAARRLFEAAYQLAFAQVSTATPVGLRLYRGRGQVVFRRLPWPNLKEALEDGPLADSEIHTSAQRFGRAVGRLHAHGLRNRDMKFENLIRNPETGEVSMVDLDGVRRKTPFDSRGQAADLGRLLAAFRAAGEPGGLRSIACFERAYNAARKSLLIEPINRRTRYLAEARASAWASAH